VAIPLSNCAFQGAQRPALFDTVIIENTFNIHISNFLAFRLKKGVSQQFLTDLGDERPMLPLPMSGPPAERQTLNVER
jgi:hypothetical protein